MLVLAAVAVAGAADPLAPDGFLDREALVAAVVAANPEVEAARGALEAARARREGAGAWRDPMVDLAVGPMMIANGMVGVSAEVRQDLPLWGVRGIAKDMGDADADAYTARLDAMRLDLARMATMAWGDWYVVARQLELIDGTVAVLTAHAAATTDRLAVGKGFAQDALQAQADAQLLSIEKIGLRGEQDVVRMEINTLLHRPLDAPVPPPPAAFDPIAPDRVGDPTRPEIDEAEAMVRMIESEVEMAQADRRPMIGLMAGWNAMAVPDGRLMAGVAVEVPLWARPRRAAVDDARARAAEARAMQSRVGDRVVQDIAANERRYEAQREAVDAIGAGLLPIARARVEAARTAFSAGMDDVRPLLDAERALLDAEVRYQQSLGALAVRAADVDLARGHLPGGGAP